MEACGEDRIALKQSGGSARTSVSGGRLFAIVGEAPAMDAILVRRVDGHEWIRESLFETVVEPLINAAAAQKFVF